MISESDFDRAFIYTGRIFMVIIDIRRPKKVLLLELYIWKKNCRESLENLYASTNKSIDCMQLLINYMVYNSAIVLYIPVARYNTVRYQFDKNSLRVWIDYVPDLRLFLRTESKNLNTQYTCVRVTAG